MNTLLYDALEGKNFSSRPPIWLMRQAGRYMASYRALKEKYTFLQLCNTPELIYQVTKLPIDQFSFDAAIVFSDILLFLQYCGFELSYETGKGPQIFPKITSRIDCEKLEFERVVEQSIPLQQGIELLCSDLNVPLLGFVAFPFTIASYMVEDIGEMMEKNPELLDHLLEKLERLIVPYAEMQRSAGCSVIQFFDSSSHTLTKEQFSRFCLPYMRRVVGKQKGTRTIVFSRGFSSHYEELLDLNEVAFSIDWGIDIRNVRKKIGSKRVLQGNLDPHILLEERSVVEKACREILATMRGDPAYIFNLGHGILPQTPEENVHLLVDLAGFIK